MANLISDEYKSLLVEKHVGKPWGGAGKSWIPHILPLLNKLPSGPITVLDYGCGRGTFKPGIEPLHPDVTVVEYDPGVLGKDVLPMKPVDYVVCTDVMEHVEQEYVVDTLRTINWLAISGVFFNIDTAPSKSFLPDGRNTHITIKSSQWWRTMLEMHIPEMQWTVHEETKSRIVISGWRQKHVE
jgi:Methyltransferase domain